MKKAFLWFILILMALASSISTYRGFAEINTHSRETHATMSNSMSNASNWLPVETDIEIDGELSEWAPEELTAYDPPYSGNGRWRNTSLVLQLAANETHCLGYLELQDDALFSPFPFNSSQAKVLDILSLQLHDAARSIQHDGFLFSVIDENYTQEVQENWNWSDFSAFSSIPGAMVASADLNFTEADMWDIQPLNSTRDWLNVSYEEEVNDIGHYRVWFAKSNLEFNMSADQLVEIEINRDSRYSDGVNDPFDFDISATAASNPFVFRLRLFNASGETLNSLNWSLVTPFMNTTAYSKAYQMAVERAISMGFRNNGENVYMVAEVELPYINQTIQAFGETYAPLCLEMWVQISLAPRNATQAIHDTQRLIYATVFNENLTTLFSGMEYIRDDIGPYPNNYDLGSWQRNPQPPLWPNEAYPDFNFAFSHSTYTNASGDKYVFEFSIDFPGINIAEYGDGIRGSNVTIQAHFETNYFKGSDYSFIVNRTEAERPCDDVFPRNCHLWDRRGEFFVGWDSVAMWGAPFNVSTAVYPIQNVTLSLDEPRGIALIESEIMDEDPFLAELNYRIGGVGNELVIEMQPRNASRLYFAEIPDLKIGNQVYYYIRVQDAINATTETSLAVFNFGELPTSSESTSLCFIFIVMGILLVGATKRSTRSARTKKMM